MKNFPEIKIENGITMVFRGTFFGIPVYSKAVSLDNIPKRDSSPLTGEKTVEIKARVA